MPQSLTMATLVETASASEKGNGTAKRRRAKGQQTNGKTPEKADEASKAAASLKAYAAKKYRHVAAVHYGPRTSCLDHDSTAAPSFLGFRNLMVIVLGISLSPLFHIKMLID